MTITNTMMNRVKSVKDTINGYAKLVNANAHELLLAEAYNAYLFKCCANFERVNYNPTEFYKECETNETFFNYYLAYAN